MKEQDIRWTQRLGNFNKALSQLKKFVDKRSSLNELEIQGLIKSFEYTYELGWNLMKDFLEFKGNQNVYGSRDAISEGFRLGLIEDGEEWMNMFADRNKTSHTYNEETAEAIAKNILEKYFTLFQFLNLKMNDLKNNNPSKKQ